MGLKRCDDRYLKIKKHTAEQRKLNNSREQEPKSKKLKTRSRKLSTTKPLSRVTFVPENVALEFGSALHLYCEYCKLRFNYNT